MNATKSRSYRLFRWVGLSLLTVALLGYFLILPWWYSLQFQNAKQAEQQRNFLEAKRLVDRYLKNKPDDPEGHLLAARITWRSQIGTTFAAGRDTAIREHLKKASQAPEFVSRVALEEELLQALRGQIKQVESRLIRRVKQPSPDNVAILEVLTRSNLDHHQLLNAFHAVNSLIEQAPDHALAYFWRGVIVELSGRRSGEAEEDLRKAVELEPDNIDFRHRLAACLASRKKTAPEAIPLYEQLYQERPEQADVLLEYAVLLLDQGEWNKARTLLEKLLQIDPNSGEGYALLGTVAMSTDRLVEAEKLLRKAVELSPGSARGTYQLLLCLERLGKKEEAAKYSRRMDEIRADQDRLEKIVGETLQQQPTLQRCYELGILYIRVGEQQLGLNWLDCALQMDPSHEPTRQTIQQIKQGKLPELVSQ